MTGMPLETEVDQRQPCVDNQRWAIETGIVPYGVSRRLRILIHVAYWMAALVFFALYYGQRPGDFVQNITYAALLLPVAIGTTYFINYRLIPRYLIVGRYAYFALALAYTIIHSVYLELLLAFGLYMTVSGYQEMVVQPDFTGLVDGLLSMYFFVAVAVAAHFVEQWFTLQRRHAHTRQARLEAELKLKEAELALLKSQIQPHFLFNALNSLYALTLEESPDAPELILKLSTLLDYVLYRAGEERVALDQELDMLAAYMELESIRCADRATISVTLPDAPPEASVAPLLILPLVENAFKHGVTPSSERVSVDVTVRISDGMLHICVTNSVPTQAVDHHAPGGIGLENLQRRLDHLYPETHTFSAGLDGDLYTARLEVPLS